MFCSTPGRGKKGKGQESRTIHVLVFLATAAAAVEAEVATAVVHALMRQAAALAKPKKPQYRELY